MGSYKDLYNICCNAWKDDWETSKLLTERARTYILVVGLVFGYSIFNISSWLQLVNQSPICILSLDKFLFILYLISFGFALLFTIFSLLVRDYLSLPFPEKIDDYQQNLSDEYINLTYFNLSKMVTQTVYENQLRTARRARWLMLSGYCLVFGTIALLIMGILIFWTRIW